jgi:hypothetical protein
LFLFLSTDGAGSVTAGNTLGKPDCTLTLSEADLVALLGGTLNAQQVRSV